MKTISKQKEMRVYNNLYESKNNIIFFPLKLIIGDAVPEGQAITST